MESYLPEYLVMIDCEMCGVVPERDALLQVAMVKMKLEGNQYKVDPKYLNAFLHYSGQPDNDFQRKYLTHVFEKCNESKLTATELRVQVENWLGPLLGKVTPAGDCVPVDMAFLFKNGVCTRGDIGDSGPIPGTFHYEYFDMNSLKAVARTKAGDKLKPTIKLQDHDALADCFSQIMEINLCLKALLG